MKTQNKSIITFFIFTFITFFSSGLVTYTNPTSEKSNRLSAKTPTRSAYVLTLIPNSSALANTTPEEASTNTKPAPRSIKSSSDAPPHPETESIGKSAIDPQISIPALQELAAKDPRAAYDLSLRYFRGDGVAQDSYLALQTMRDAGERGVLEAQKALGQLYMTGLEEMGSDLQEAQKWLSIAASRGDKEASQLLEKVTSARENEEEFYNYRRQLYPYTYRYWYYDSPYKLRWRRGYWRH